LGVYVINSVCKILVLFHAQSMTLHGTILLEDISTTTKLHKKKDVRATFIIPINTALLTRLLIAMCNSGKQMLNHDSTK